MDRETQRWAQPNEPMSDDIDFEDLRFADRARIALFERDPALRPVIIRSLLRLGCVVSAKRDLGRLQTALQEGLLHGAVADLEFDVLSLEALDDANRSHVPLAVLTDIQVEPYLRAQFPTLSFIQKPFDIRVLFDALKLPRKPR